MSTPTEIGSLLKSPQGAVFSSDGRYRYLLWRTVGDSGGTDLSFIMLNPSTASATEDDPTIRRCVGFAKEWGCSRLLVANLYALRSTDPKELWRTRTLEERMGAENRDWLRAAVKQSDLVVAAWGAEARKDPFSVEAMFSGIAKAARKPIFRLGEPTRYGQPRHPLYVRGDVMLQSVTLGEL
ncbi:DUF1643 domain-containing protein [Patescibacteria group bacterium]|nr:DUF1643 domain-containing protein [Patescibacteria group bacterium]